MMVVRDDQVRFPYFFLRSFPASVCNEAMNFSWVLNGPYDRPSL
jgi:hypothetical protein